jgi:hypothetical protein
MSPVCLAKSVALPDETRLVDMHLQNVRYFVMRHAVYHTNIALRQPELMFFRVKIQFLTSLNTTVSVDVYGSLRLSLGKK